MPLGIPTERSNLEKKKWYQSPASPVRPLKNPNSKDSLNIILKLQTYFFLNQSI